MDIDQRILDYYRGELQKGLRPPTSELKQFARDNAISVSNKALDKVKFAFDASAGFAHWKSPRPFYVTSLIPKVNVCFIDVMHAFQKFKYFNDGYQYIIVGVRQVSGFLTALPAKNKSRETWHKLILRMILADYPQNSIAYIVSDRDASISSATFQDYIRAKFGIKWVMIGSRNKAYLAERGGYTK